MNATVISLLVICTLYLFSNVHASDLPAGITKCSIVDQNCLKNSINYAIKNYATTGNENLGLIQLDPLRISKLRIGMKPNSPVNIDLSFTNADLFGLKDAQVKQVSAFTRDLSRPLKLIMISPKISLKGPYSVDGKVLILPVQGKGLASIELKNCNVHAIVKLKSVSKGPQRTFAEVVEIKMKLEPDHVSYHLEGLMNGNKEQSDAFHALINQHWKDIFDELKDDISTAMSLIFKSVMSRTLSTHPLEQLFTDV